MIPTVDLMCLVLAMHGAGAAHMMTTVTVMWVACARHQHRFWRFSGAMKMQTANLFMWVYTHSDQPSGVQATTADMTLHLLQVFVGYTLVHILGQCNRFHFAQREARWDMVTAALGVLRAALQTSTLTPAGSEGQQASCPALHRLVAQELAQQSYPETCLFINLPPPAGEAAGCAVLCTKPGLGPCIL